MNESAIRLDDVRHPVLNHVELTGYGRELAAHDNVTIVQTGTKIPRAAERLVAAIVNGDKAEAARLLRACPSLHGALVDHDPTRIRIGAGYASICFVPAPSGSWPGQRSWRGWALAAAEALAA